MRIAAFLIALLFSVAAQAQSIDSIGGFPGPTGTAGGVLSGTYPNPGFAATPTFTGALTSSAVISAGTKFTTSGCSVSATTGGAAAGTFTVGAANCTVVVTINGATGLTAPSGWACAAEDTSALTILISQSASSTTTASFNIPVTAGATDVIKFFCMGY